MSIFKACDVRGVVGAEWDESDALKIGRSLGRLMRMRGETAICVGGDLRRSTPSLKENLIEGLIQSGADVFDVGLQPTPVVYFAARHLGCHNLATVTASHNPGEYNGIKFQLQGEPPAPELMQELERGARLLGPDAQPGTVTSHDVLAEYERWVVPHARSVVRKSNVPDAAPVRTHGKALEEQAHHLRVVIDSMGGAFTHAAPAILAAAGHRVTSLWSEPDRDFAGRSPNPSDDENLANLISAVIDQGADVGIALDGDGDRAVLVDHGGAIVRPEQLAVVMMQQCFDQPTVIYDLKCASILAHAVAAAGGTAVMRPSGYGFIKAEMIRRSAEMGVEASGHHFFGTLGGGDDGMFTALVALEIVQQVGRPLADLIQPVGWPAITSDIRVPFQRDRAVAIDSIAARCGGQISRLDGVRSQYEDGWALARPSITEPAITFRFEGRTRDDLGDIAMRFLADTPELLEPVMEKIDE